MGIFNKRDVKMRPKIDFKDLSPEKIKRLQSISPKEFWSLCKAQYSILFPVLILYNLILALVIFVILKFWWRV